MDIIFADNRQTTLAILFVSIKIVYDLLKEKNQPNNLVVVEEKENDSEKNESTNTLEEETTEVEISKEESY